MTPRSDTLELPWTEPPATTEARDVADGLFWVRLPLPVRLNHVNVWLLREDDGWTVVDTGCATGELFASWETLLASVMQGLPIRWVISPHGHINHLIRRGLVEKTADADGRLLFRLMADHGRTGLRAGATR